MKAKQCNDCKSFKYDFEKTPSVWCLKNHKLRFYKPKFIMDFDAGWKRKCNDFERIEE
jgi:hypothetical protein